MAPSLVASEPYAVGSDLPHKSKQTAVNVTETRLTDNAVHSVGNGHHGSDRASTNGHRAGRLQEPRDVWNDTLRGVTDRPDLSGMSRDAQKYRDAIDSNVYTMSKPIHRSLRLNGSTFASLHTRCRELGIAPSWVLLFVLHRLYNVYSNGNHTVIASVESESSGDRISITAMDHEDEFSSFCVETIAEMGRQCLESSLPLNEASVEQCDPRLLDSVACFAHKPHPSMMQRPLAFLSEFHSDSLTLSAYFDAQIFLESTIDAFLSVLEIMLRQLANESELRVRDLEFLPPSHLEQIQEWNSTEGDYPMDTRLNELIEAAAERTPEKVAIVFREVSLTYRELNERANQLARHIRYQLGARPEQLISLFLEKSELMIITILAVWKSGAAYTPIDPAYPNDRVEFLLRDTGVQHVISNEKLAERMRSIIKPDQKIDVIPLEPLLDNLSKDESVPRHNLELGLRSTQLAYLTYTSGTTGVPKGIFKVHRSVVNSITDLSERYGVRGSDGEAILLFAAYVFEPFVRQTLMALINSQLLAIISDTEKLDPRKLVNFINRHKVTYLNATASVLKEFDFDECPSLRRLILVGEDLTETRYKELRRAFKHRIFNEYGFTESAFVTALNVFDANSTRTNRSLGRPLRNVKWYVLNKALKQVPVGAIGELHIGGLGVAQGYHNRPDLTSQRFLKNVFQTADEWSRGVNGLIYKTGDLARLLPNSEIEFLGRNDFQVKIRGLRIEPGEIESVLSTYPGIRFSVVTSREYRGDKHLIGFFVSETSKIPEAELLAFLESKLPRYMVPTRLVQIDRIPTNINGKTDLRALPEVDLVPTTQSVKPVRNDLDRVLRKLWSELLGLPEESIGVEDNFFRLGGHSIICIQLLSRVRRTLHLEMSVEDVFTTRTLGNLSDLLSQREMKEDSQLQNGRPNGTSFIPPQVERDENIESCYLANSLQQGFVYRHLKETGLKRTPYIMQSSYTYESLVDSEIFKSAWGIAQKRFSSLRMCLSWEGDILQLIYRSADFGWQFLDFSNKSVSEQEESLKSLSDEDRRKGYDLRVPGLFRVYLVKLAPSHYRCLLSCHHAILDGWSMPPLFEFVHDTYLQLTQNKSVSLEADTVYAATMAHSQEHRKDHVDYWRSQVNKIDERCDLNSLLNEASRNKVLLDQYDAIDKQREKTLTLDSCWTKKLREVCYAEGITLHSILQFIWHSILHSYGGGNQTVVGTIVSGRNLPVSDIETCVGLLINTLPMVVDHQRTGDETIFDAIRAIQIQANAMNSRSNVDLSSVQDQDLKHGLFDSLFVLENYPNRDKSAEASHKELLHFETIMETEELDYPLAVVARENKQGDGFTFTICYAAELFDDETIDDLLDMVGSLFRQISENPSRPVSELQYLGPNQLARLDRWNANEAPFQDTMTLHGVFEQEVERVPSTLAVIDENTRLTYAEMNAKANQLARYIRSTCVDLKPDNIVALVLDKSVFMMTSIFAIWKSGAAFVPIDPTFPDDRISYILKDTQARMIITDTKYVEHLKVLTEGRLPIADPDLLRKELAAYDTNNLVPISSATDLAYIIFTSGTTGNPKGVMLEHRGVVNLQQSLSKIFSLKDPGEEVIFTFSNYVFDHFIEVFTDALLNGQTMLMLNDEMRSDKDRLYRYLKTNKVTYLSGTPSVVSMYEFHELKHLRRIDCIGEAFSEPVFNKIRESHKGLVINGYGPTEISITSHKRLYQANEWRKDGSIGKHIANTTSYMLDDNMKLVPIGAVGELFIGGAGVARGYHNLPHVSAAKFVPNPFQTEDEKRRGVNGRLYRTGDLARWLPRSDGEIEYLGRNDFQVKVRGIRIELTEIENVMTSYPGIKQGAVVSRKHVRSDAEGSTLTYLVGYYISDLSISEHDIKKFMQSKLPDYMVPNRLIPVPSLPVTISGKLDTKKLPPADYTYSNEYVSPRNEIDTTLCSIFADILGIEADRVGIHDDFFSLGGDSLLSTKLSFRISKAFSRQITVAAIFKHRTVEEISNTIQFEAEEIEDIAGVADTSAPLPASIAQEGILFIEEFEKGTDAYDIVLNFSLPAETNMEALQKSFRSVLVRHKSLRTIIAPETKAGNMLLKVLDEETAQQMFTFGDGTMRSAEDLEKAILQDARYVFHLRDELPLRVRFYSLEQTPETRYMSVVLHHSCFDGWSWNVLKRDLSAFYQFHIGLTSEVSLPPLKVDYLQFAQWQKSRFSGERRRKVKEFWLRRLDDFEQLHLPTDFPRPETFQYEGRDLRFKLSSTAASNLRSLAKNLRVSLHSVLVGAFSLMLSVYTNQNDIGVGVPVANREQAELENVVGLFVNMLVLRLKIDYDSPVVEYLKRVSHELIQAQLHQDMPFQEIVKDQKVEKDSSRHPLVQAIFNFEAISSKNSEEASSQDLRLVDYHDSTEYSTSKFDLAMTLTDTETELSGILNFPVSLFSMDTIERLSKLYSHLLDQISDLSPQSETKVSQIDLVKEGSLPASKVESLDEVPESADEYQTLNKLFEAQIPSMASQTAVISSEAQLTYGELNQKANQFARYLQWKATMVPDDKVALMLDRSAMIPLSMVAVWKAGGAYVPLDPSAPEQRVRHIISDTGAKVIITNSKYVPRLMKMDLKTEIVAIDSPTTTAILGTLSTENMNPPVQEGNLAYVIYTSGTTGNPKGVAVEHGNVVSLRNSLKAYYIGNSSKQQEGVLMLSNYVFDFSVEQYLLGIFCSNRLILPPPDYLFNDELYEYLNQSGLTYISGTPSLVRQFDLTKLNSLRIVTVAGEELIPKVYQKIRSEFSGLIHNAYGVTETTVYNLVHRFESTPEFSNSLGRTLVNTKGHVLNSSLQVVPEGSIGELYLSGECVARGYLNLPAVTEKAFLKNPFASQPGNSSVLYKTGDLVRKLPGGALQYLGRNDDQIKIRGFRVELSEIRAALTNIPDIKDGVVIAKFAKSSSKSKQAKYLTGFYVTDNDSMTSERVLAILQEKLPAYMIPSHLVRLEGALSLTINGKIDVKSLPDIDFETAKESTYTKPKTRMEQNLAAIIYTLLDITDIGVDDDFFKLGGDSILSLQLASQIRREIGIRVTVKDIFDLKTIRGLCAKFPESELQNGETPAVEAEQGHLVGEVPMLPIQKWFFAKRLQNPAHWNQFFTIVVPQLDAAKLKSAIQKLVDHHDAFRFRYHAKGTQVAQRYGEDGNNFIFKKITATTVEDSVLNSVQCDFDLKEGPIAAFAYVTGLDDGTARIVISCHHLMVDTVSWRILLRDLQTLYEGGNLELKDTSFRQFSIAAKEYACPEAERQYWKRVFERMTEAPSSLPNAASQTLAETEVLDVNMTSTLLRRCQRTYDTRVVEFLLTAVGYVVKSITNTDRNFVLMEGHGRESIKENLNVGSTVGWFTTMFPYEVETSGDIGSSLSNTRKSFRKIPNNGFGFGALHGYKSSALPKITFNYLGQLDRTSSSNSTWDICSDPATYGLSVDAADKDVNDSLIDITAVVTGGQMTFHVSSRLGNACPISLASLLKSQIMQMVQHTDLRADTPQNISSTEDEFIPYFDFNSKSSSSSPSQTLFLLPPGEGGAESYFNNFAKHMSSSTRLILFNNYYLDIGCLKGLDFKTLGQMYVAWMREQQPYGPYHLLGWSFGGVLSFEIARQLVAAGEKIATLAFIDPYFNTYQATKAVGLTGQDDILDPINYYYLQNGRSEEERKTEPLAERVVLFKAPEMNETYRNPEQKTLYQKYRESELNYLDTLIEKERIRKVVLEGEDHFSWVRNEGLVKEMCRVVEEGFLRVE